MIEDPIQVMLYDDDSGDFVPYAIPRSQVMRLKAISLIDNALASPKSTGIVTIENLTQEALDKFRDTLIWTTFDTLRKLPS